MKQKGFLAGADGTLAPPSEDRTSSPRAARQTAAVLDMYGSEYVRQKFQMTLAKPFTPSERYARLVLAAWYQRDSTKFQAVLKRKPFLGVDPPAFVERERIDLIQDLAQSIAMWEGSGQAEDAANLSAALGLTRHLARWDQSEGN